MAGGGELGEEVAKRKSATDESLPEISLDSHAVRRYVEHSPPERLRPQAWSVSNAVEVAHTSAAQLPNQVPLGCAPSSEEVRRQGSSLSAHASSAPGLHADVWEVVEGAWQVTHQFEHCLEMDCTLSGCTKKTRAHLPVASLRALEHLHALLRTPESVSLDLAVDDSAGYGKVSSLLLNRAAASLSPVDLAEAGALLQQRSQVARKLGGPNTASLEPPVRLETPGMEVADIAVCALKGSCDEAQVPVLSFGRLARPMLLESLVQAPPVRFVGLVLCGAQRMQLATQLACALAVAIMDDDFANALRSAPSSSQQGVLEAFELYLSTLTILPTVYSPGGASLAPMTDSLVDQLQNTLFRSPRGPATLAEAQGGCQRAGPAQPETARPTEGRQHFIVEVHEMTGGATRCSTTHRFQCGLEVDVAKTSERPHLPRVNVVALAKARKLMTPSSVVLDAAAEDAVLDRLIHGGLPHAAHGEVVLAMAGPEQASDAPGTCEHDDIGSRACRALIKPVGKEEACHVLAVTCKQLPHTHGIVGAFVRFRSHQSLGFSPKSPTRFVLCFVGPESATNELSTMVDSVAALAVDEELMADLIAAGDVPCFLGSLDARLDRLLVVPHTRLQAAMKRTLSQSTSVSSASVSSEDASSQSPVCVKGVEQPKPRRRTVLDLLRYTVRKVRKYSLPLVLGVLIALIWGNADMVSYHEFVDTPLFGWEFKTGNKVHTLSLHFVVNDIFMCFFFGLAIKEVIEALLPGGSLNPVRRAVNPLLATVGGVAGPALAYTLMVSALHLAGVFDGTQCVSGTETSSASHRRLDGATTEGPVELCSLGTILRGWGVTIATDISLAWMFALLIFGAGHPAINFLLLLAIVDDALGMVIIAVCYPDPANPVVPWWLLLVLAAMLMACALRMLKVSFWTPYIFLCGPVSWFGLLAAHVHPALALVFVVPFMPAHTSLKRAALGSRKWGTRMWQTSNSLVLQRASEMLAQHHAEEAPLHMFEHTLKLPVDFGMFFFGLANAGVSLNEAGALTVSVLAALIAGKTLGIAGAGLLASCMGFSLPLGVSVADLFTISALGGTGLTVALFVANEAFVDAGLQGQAKFAAVLSVGSVCLACAIRWASSGCNPQPAAESPKGRLSMQRHSAFDIVLPEGVAEAAMADEAGYLDDVLVEELMQIMWMQRRYRARASSLPFLEQHSPLNSPGSATPSGGQRSMTPGFGQTLSDAMTSWRTGSKRSTASRTSRVREV